MSNRQEMIDEANVLGLEFPGNISNIKLSTLIAEEKGAPVPVDETPPPSPAAKVEDFSETAAETMASVKSVQRTLSQRKNMKRREHIARAKKVAMRTHIVTITNKDPRENDVMTTAYLSFENQHFGISRLVPLDTPVELEAALIHIAANCTMTQHRDEISEGRRTGNKVPVRTKKYAISYSTQVPVKTARK